MEIKSLLRIGPIKNQRPLWQDDAGERVLKEQDICVLFRKSNEGETLVKALRRHGIDFSFYKQIIGTKKVSFINNKTYDLLSVSYAALVASGTATLETALFKVPQVVCYKGGYISYQIAKRIITLKFISLVNLILDKEVVKELIQEDFNKQNLKVALTNISQKEKSHY